jgi:RNA polymerase sigma-32 factor
MFARSGRPGAHTAGVISDDDPSPVGPWPPPREPKRLAFELQSATGMHGNATHRNESARSDGIRYLLSGAGSRPLGGQLQNQLAASYHQTKDRRLERRLVEANLRLVVKIARDSDRSRRRHLEDLVQEGCLGLIEAVRRFDPSKGAQFSTYAGFWIRAFIMRHIMDNVRVVRVVRSRAERLAFFKGVVGGAEVSFDVATGPDGVPLCEMLAAPASSPEDLLTVVELTRLVKKEVTELEARLPGREATIMKERLLAAEPRSQRDVGRQLSLSGERVRQIEGRLLAAIQARLGVGPAPIAAAA